MTAEQSIESVLSVYMEWNSWYCWLQGYGGLSQVVSFDNKHLELIKQRVYQHASAKQWISFALTVCACLVVCSAETQDSLMPRASYSAWQLSDHLAALFGCLLVLGIADWQRHADCFCGATLQCRSHGVLYACPQQGVVAAEYDICTVSLLCI